MLRHALIAAVLCLSLVVPLKASTLPLNFVLSEMGEMWKPLGKTGLAVKWQVQNYENGEATGDVQNGKLYLKSGQYRAELADKSSSQVRIYDNANSVVLENGRFAIVRRGVQSSLPEGIFLRYSNSSLALLEAYGVDANLASFGRMPSEDPERPFHTVLRYGAAQGKEDLSKPQIWIEPHTWNIHRVIAIEGEKLLQVDYKNHGAVSEDQPWLPSDIIVSKGGVVLWTAHITELLTELPNSKTFDIKALEAQAKN